MLQPRRARKQASETLTDWRAAKSAHRFISTGRVKAAGSTTQPLVDLCNGSCHAVDVDRALRAAFGNDGGAGWPPPNAGTCTRGCQCASASARGNGCDEESRAIGQPSQQGRPNVMALARYQQYDAVAAHTLQNETIPHQPGFTVLALREPHNVTGHIIPCIDLQQIFGRSVGTARAAGNACVVTPAEDACLPALLLLREVPPTHRIAHESDLRCSVSGLGLCPVALAHRNGAGLPAGRPSSRLSCASAGALRLQLSLI
ncbi:MAG: aldehyde dehydrogenase family protein, partial [Burkholderiaceae bacterium]|nr:aldehyde dehydrogenase family protein [Burkholderiaceae bacterium]